MGGALGECLDLARERRARGSDRYSTRLLVRMVRFPRSEDAGRADRAASGLAAARRRDRVPLLVWGIGLRCARDPGGTAPRECAVAAAGSRGDPAGSCLF